MYPPFLHRGTSVLFKDRTACYAHPKKRKTSRPCTIKIGDINLLRPLKSSEKNRPHTFIYNFAKNTQFFLYLNLFSIFFINKRNI